MDLPTQDDHLVDGCARELVARHTAHLEQLFVGE
jgi:hypothetical protein